MTRLAVTAGAVLVFVLAACGAPSPTPTPTPIPTLPVAAPGEILIPACPDNADCADGFVVGDQYYSLVCSGVDPAAVADATLATGEGMFVETRTITNIPSDLWLAVRGDVPCRPLDHDWYLVMNEGGISPEALEEWGPTVGEVIIP